jgi:FKBP-type peptidyl-prolyl cis-trans isomerase SlyD
MKNTITEESKIVIDYTIESISDKSMDSKSGISIDMTKKNIFSKFHKALMGKSEGTELVVNIKEDENETRAENESYIDLKKSDFEGEIKVGDYYKARGEVGSFVGLKISEIDDEKVIGDGNHPLIGMEFTIKAKIISIANN